MKRILVTGAAGFIGSNLVDRLLLKDEVIGLDNFRTGKLYNLDEANKNSNFKFLNFDLQNSDSNWSFLDGVDIVYHLAANADVKGGVDNTRIDLELNTIVTYNILENMRLYKVKKIVFASTGSIYGESMIIPTPENADFPIQTSLYGASKLASEGLIAAFSGAFDIQSWIFRFVSILGPRYSHGHIIDFYNKLKSNPNDLEVLGNGHQQKSYLHVDDCIQGLLSGINNFSEEINILNLGHTESCTVRDSIQWILEHLSLDPKITYGESNRGWIGDNPHIHLDISKIMSAGWKPRKSIKDSVIDTVRYLQHNTTLLDSELI